jgi:acid phosphatase (class A)
MPFNPKQLSVWLVSALLLISPYRSAHAENSAAMHAPTANQTERGYLSPTDTVDSLALLPPPPADGSAGFALDLTYAQKSFALRNGPAWALAMQDADLSFPNAASTYACALGVPLDQKHAPHLYKLLQRVKQDAGAATGAAKNHYMRRRPFMMNDAPLCTPETRAELEKNGSYPSGHNAIGMTWGLLLSEIAPTQADVIMARAQAYGMSRIACNAHWYSDTLWGRYLGAYTIAKLHANAHFQDDLSDAKEELEDLREEGLPPNRDCVAERLGIEAQKALTQ